MTDLLSALVGRSKEVADPRAAAYASGNRAFQVRITRPAVLGVYDRDARSFVNPADTLIYEGPARIYTATGGAELDVGDERTVFSVARATIDHYDGDPPKADDLLEVLATPQSTQTHVQDRVFSVGSVEVGGHFGIGYALALSGAAPTRRG